LGIFTPDGSGRGQAIVLNDDGSLNTAENPAKPGSLIVLFVTGEGLTDPAGVEDHIIGDILPAPKLPLMAFITWPSGNDCDFAGVVSASSVRGSVPGLLEVKLRLSDPIVCNVGPSSEVLRGTVSMSLRSGQQQFYSYSQPGVTLAIK
jgi:uncharacterized protein (TIGR03437 family)